MVAGRDLNLTHRGDVPRKSPAIIIGVVSFSLSFLGVYLGGKLGRFLRNRVELLGGLILIVIGVRILVEHSGIA